MGRLMHGLDSRNRLHSFISKSTIIRNMADVTLGTAEIRNWETFHDICARDFGFPGFYGRNMNAWIDCLTYVREGDGMSRFVLQEDEYLYIHLPDFVTFSQREPVISSQPV